ncbi:MAG TPA: hypothetical protein VK210_16000 [Terriglobia bacterium]|nr:hypothetical protein [Terriglobia bacterium]
MNPKSELDRELEALLGAEPSAEFVSRVKKRIAKTPEPTVWNAYWTVFAAGAVAATIVLAVFLAMPHRTDLPGGIKPLPDSAMLSNVPPTLAPPASGSRNTAAPRNPVLLKAVKEPEILIAPEEAAALRRLIRGDSSRWTGLSNSLDFPSAVSDISVQPQRVPAIAVASNESIEPISIEPSISVASPKGVTQ